MLKSERLKSRINNPQSGMALVVAIILMLAIITLGSAYLILTISESRRAKVDQEYIQGLPAAEGGIDHALWRLQNDPYFLAQVTAPSVNPGDTLSYTFTFPPGPQGDTVTIIIQR